MTEFKRHAEIAEDPATGEEVVIIHGEFIHPEVPLQTSRVYPDNIWMATKASRGLMDLRVKYQLLREACTRCSLNQRFDMAEIWRRHAERVFLRTCEAYATVTPK
jgi:hypothetical protein